MAAADAAATVEALLRGDERAFEWLVQQHHTTLVRLASKYVRDPAIAEEVAQETWLHVLKGLPRFQLRSSLKTWMSPPEERALVDRHLASCDGCQAYVQQMRLTIMAIGHVSEDAITSKTREDVLAIFRTWRERQTRRQP